MGGAILFEWVTRSAAIPLPMSARSAAACRTRFFGEFFETFFWVPRGDLHVN